jgi:hypothetical protein
MKMSLPLALSWWLLLLSLYGAINGAAVNKVDVHVTDVSLDTTSTLCMITLAVGDCAPGIRPIYAPGVYNEEPLITTNWGDGTQTILRTGEATQMTHENGAPINVMNSDKLAGKQIMRHMYNLTSLALLKAAGTNFMSPSIECHRLGNTALFAPNETMFDIETMCTDRAFDWNAVNSAILPRLSTDVQTLDPMYISPRYACIPFVKNVQQWNVMNIHYQQRSLVPGAAINSDDEQSVAYMRGSTGTTCFKNVGVLGSETGVVVNMKQGRLTVSAVSSQLRFMGRPSTGVTKAGLDLLYEHGEGVHSGTDYREPVLAVVIRNFGRPSSQGGNTANTFNIQIIDPRMAPLAGFVNKTIHMEIISVIKTTAHTRDLYRNLSLTEMNVGPAHDGFLHEFECPIHAPSPDVGTVYYGLVIAIRTKENNSSTLFGERMDFPLMELPFEHPFISTKYLYEKWVVIRAKQSNRHIFEVPGCMVKPSILQFDHITTPRGWQEVNPAYVTSLTAQALVLNCKHSRKPVCDTAAHTYRVACVA